LHASIASFLGVVSYLAYKRVRGTRMLLMTIGFMALGAVEILYFLDATDILPMVHLPVANIELSHMILMIMIAFFGLDVLTNSDSMRGS
jgi:hypothetical protein